MKQLTLEYSAYCPWCINDKLAMNGFSHLPMQWGDNEAFLIVSEKQTDQNQQKSAILWSVVDRFTVHDQVNQSETGWRVDHLFNVSGNVYL